MFENQQRIAGCFGRTALDPLYRSVFLEAYASALPPAEPAWSNISLINERLANSNNQVLFPIDGNDRYGDCTIAGAGHLITLLAGLSGLTVIPDAKTIVDTYFKLSGGRDNGLNISDVLLYWYRTGIAGNKIAASVQITPGNWDLVKQAVQFFGAVYIGFKVPSNCQQQFQQHVPWTGGHLTSGGHCVVVTDYRADGSGTCLTWGNKQDFTPAWWKQCVDEVHAVVTSYTSVIDHETLANLIADVKALGH